MKEQLLKDNKFYSKFWDELINEKENLSQYPLWDIECKFDGIKYHLIRYINNKMIKMKENKALSWLKFYKNYLSNLSRLSKKLGMGEEDILSVCFEEFTKVKNATKKRKYEYISWDDFKEIYLPEIEGLAEILGIERHAIIKTYEINSSENYPVDDDWKFIDGVVHCISLCESKGIREKLIRKIKETVGAKEIFDEIYRIWCSKVMLDDGIFFLKNPEYGGERAQPGKGEIIDIFLLERSSGKTIFTSTVGEDYADCSWPVVVKVKQNSNVNREELIAALRDLASSLITDFKDCFRRDLGRALQESGFYGKGYEVPESEEIRAFLTGLHKANPELHAKVARGHELLLSAMEEVGWFDPKAPLGCGIEDALKKKWPEIHKRVLGAELSPFEALFETGCIYPEDVRSAASNRAFRIYDKFFIDGKTCREYEGEDYEKAKEQLVQEYGEEEAERIILQVEG